MAGTRDTACKFYVCEGECEKGKEGTFKDSCQKCRFYSPVTHKKGFRPANIKRAKEEAYNKRRVKEMMDEDLEGEF